jgi:hypothetical protein
MAAFALTAGVLDRLIALNYSCLSSRRSEIYICCGTAADKIVGGSRTLND